jgi:hypothetical protein
MSFTCDWSPESFNELKQLIAEHVPAGDRRRYSLGRIGQSSPDPAKPLKGEDDMAKFWEDQARSSPSLEIYEKHLAQIWRETGCAAEGTPYVLRGLLIPIP